jgi:YjbE family integral membrane protein
MELVSPEFLSALVAIVVIDLVLAGDNAIVIALAARNLPARLQRRAIVWGAFGAVAVRTALTLVAVWLLQIPGLLAAGGALLVWIAYRLVAPGADGKRHVDAVGSFWGAMKTIVIADAVMGIDNVIAVAGAAHGNYLLVVLGLLISVPIVIWGSAVVLKWLERFPVLVYFGAAVLAWTAAKMLTAEPLVAAWLEGQRAAHWAISAALVGGTLGYGYLRNRRLAAAAQSV